MPYMPCKHTGCNETVKVPNKYCGIHTPKKASDLTITVKTGQVAKELLKTKDKPKKTTK